MKGHRREMIGIRREAIGMDVSEMISSWELLNGGGGALGLEIPTGNGKGEGGQAKISEICAGSLV